MQILFANKNFNISCPQGFNGADLRNVCTEAGMFAIRADRDYVVQEDFMKVHTLFLLDTSALFCISCMPHVICFIYGQKFNHTLTVLVFCLRHVFSCIFKVPHGTVGKFSIALFYFLILRRFWV